MGHTLASLHFSIQIKSAPHQETQVVDARLSPASVTYQPSLLCQDANPPYPLETIESKHLALSSEPGMLSQTCVVPVTQ